MSTVVLVTLLATAIPYDRCSELSDVKEHDLYVTEQSRMAEDNVSIACEYCLALAGCVDLVD